MKHLLQAAHKDFEQKYMDSADYQSFIKSLSKVELCAYIAQVFSDSYEDDNSGTFDLDDLKAYLQYSFEHIELPASIHHLHLPRILAYARELKSKAA